MTFYLAWFSFAVLLHRVLRMWHPDPWHNRINMILIPTSCNFFSGSWSPKNSEVKRACSEKFGDGWPTGKLFPGAHEWGQSVQKKYVLVCEDSLCPKKLLNVSGPDLGEAGRYSAPLNACLIKDLWFFPSSLSYLVSLPPHAVSNSRSSCSTCYFAQSPVSQLHVITVFKPDNNTIYYSSGPTQPSWTTAPASCDSGVPYPAKL